MRKMRLKKRKKHKILTILIIIIFTLLLVNNLVKQVELNSNEQILKKLIQNSNYHLIYDDNLLDNFNNLFNIKNPILIIEQVFAYEKDYDEQAFAYIQNNLVSNPIVYIYNTHPNEEYLGEKLEEYELDNNVILASIILQEKLNELGVPTVVEERNVTKYLNNNNLKFADSYKVTRNFLQEKINNQQFKLIIDLHRDAVLKNITTTTINDKEYAKIMFVQNINYKNNISLANKLNDILEEKYPSISRGIYNKYVDNFNQDLADNILLIELGGNYNTIDEVVNTIDALAVSIKELLK